MKTTFFPALMAGLLIACTASQPGKPALRTETTAASFIEPLEGAEIKPRLFTVSATKAGEIELTNGGKITLPANAFVDQEGKPVRGKVTIEWQEYHSLPDIMASGIPMMYDSAGVEAPFISGGMFTINGKQKGKDVEIAPGKELKIDLGSNDPQQQFNFYQLDEQSGKWSYKKTALATLNPEAEAEQPANLPKRDVFLNVNVPVDAAAYPELAKDEIVGWEVSPNQLSAKEKDLLGRVSWKAEIVAKDGEDYKLALTNQAKTMTLKADPVFFSEAKKNTANVDARTKQQWTDLLAYQELEKQAALIRSTGISEFGSFNWDCIPKTNINNLSLHLQTSDGRDLAAAQIFQACPEARVSRQYKQDDLKKFSFIPKSANCIIAIFPDKAIYTLSDEVFDEARNRKDLREFTFKLKRRDERFNGGKVLGKLIRKLV